MIEQLFEEAPVDINKVMQQMQNIAADLGLPFGKREKTYNSRLAQELGLWAESRHRGDDFHLAAFRAYFADGRNLAEIPVLLDLAESVDLPVEEAEQVLTTRSFRVSVDQDWQMASRQGITAVPTLAVGGKKLVGAQPYHVMARFVEENSAQ